MFQSLFIALCKHGIPSINDYRYKSRIEILYKKMCYTAPHFCPQPDFLGNSWKHRTLARMYTNSKLIQHSSDVNPTLM